MATYLHNIHKSSITLTAMTTQEYDDDFVVELQSDSDDDFHPRTHTPSMPNSAPTPTTDDSPVDYTPSTPSYALANDVPIDYTRGAVSNSPPKRSPSPSPPQSPNARRRCTKEQFYRLTTPAREEFKRIDPEAFDHMPLYPADEPVHSQPKRRRTDHDDNKGDGNGDNRRSQQHHQETLTSSSSPITASPSPSPIIPSHLTTVSTPADLIRVYADHLDEPTKTAFVADATALYGHRFDQALGDPALWTTTLTRIAAHINTVDADIVLATVLNARRIPKRPQAPKNTTNTLKLATLKRRIRDPACNPRVLPTSNNAETEDVIATINAKTKDVASQLLGYGWTLHVITSETHDGTAFAEPVTELYIQRPDQKPTRENLVIVDCFGKKGTKLYFNLTTETYYSKNTTVRVDPNATRFTDAARFHEAYP